MNVKNLLRIVKKDWIEIRNNKNILVPLLLIPALLSIIFPLFLTLPTLVSAGVAAFLIAIDLIIKPLLLMIPTMAALIIASDSIAGEKERKTIESFLVLPLTDREILIGKVLSALIPSLVSSWISFFLMGLTLNIAARPNLGSYIIIFGDASWWLLELLLVTIFSFMTTLFMVLISAIVRNVRVAQQYSLIAIMPIAALLIGGVSQAFVLDVNGILILSGILGVIVLGLAYITTRRLNREKLILALD